MKKAMSCLLSFLPLIFLIISMIGIIKLAAVESQTLYGAEALGAMFYVFCAFVAVVLCYGVMIWYIIKTCKNPEFTTGTKVGWGVALYFLNVFVFPVYWFMYISKEY